MIKQKRLKQINVRKTLKNFYINNKYNRRKRSRSEKLFIIEGSLTNAAIVLNSGIFLSGYIIYLGGSDFLTGLLNNSLAWASMAAIASALLFERMKQRKKLIITFFVLSRLLVCSIIFLPLFFKIDERMLIIIAVMIIVGNMLWSFFDNGRVVWMMNTVPKNVRKEFIYTRMFWLRIAFTLTTIVMGFVLDAFNKSYEGFFIVFITSIVLYVINLVVLIKIEEPECYVNNTGSIKLSQIMEPWGNRKFREYLLFVILFYFGLNISISFSPLYLIRYMEFDYKFISAITVLCNIFMILSTKFWSRIEWKKDARYVLKIGGLFMAAETLIYAFLTKKTYILLFLAATVSGIGNGGFNVALLNHRYDLIPEQNKSIYEAWFGAFYGFGTIIGPITGGYLLDSLPIINKGILQHSNFQILYLMSFASVVIIIFSFFGIKDKVKNLNSNNIDKIAEAK